MTVRSGRRAAGTLALVAQIGMSWACAPGVSPGAPARGTLVVALKGDIDSWNPYTTHDATSAGVLDLLYPRLVLETGDSESPFEPWLARSWEFSADRLQLVFHLEPDAVWTDGSPVTCEDVRFTYSAQLSEGLAWSGVFLKNRISGVDCSDPWTAVFLFTEAYADQLIDANDNAIVPSAYAEVPFPDWAATAWEKRIVTSGPFRLTEVHPGQEAVLERDPRWWRTPGALLERVILRIYPEATGAFPRLLDGEVDLVIKVPALRAAEVAARDDLRLVALPSLRYAYLGWNTLSPRAYLEDRKSRGCAGSSVCSEGPADVKRLQHEHPHPILSDSRVRKALTLAIDREDLVQGIWRGHARVGGSPIVSGLWAHDATVLPFDMEQASELLDEAGWSERDANGTRHRRGQPLELRVIVNSENRVRRDALERATVGLRRIGVRVVPTPLPRREFVTRARNKDFDVVLSGWSAGTRIQPQNLLHTRAAVNRGNNLVSWSTPESDRLLDEAAVTTDPDQAGTLWRGWQRIFREEQPLTILYEERLLLGISRRFDHPLPSYLNPLQNLHQWHLRGD